MAVGRFDVYLVSLDPTVGSEIKKLGRVSSSRQTR